MVDVTAHANLYSMSAWTYAHIAYAIYDHVSSGCHVNPSGNLIVYKLLLNFNILRVECYKCLTQDQIK